MNLQKDFFLHSVGNSIECGFVQIVPLGKVRHDERLFMPLPFHPCQFFVTFKVSNIISTNAIFP